MNLDLLELFFFSAQCMWSRTTRTKKPPKTPPWRHFSNVLSILMAPSVTHSGTPSHNEPVIAHIKFNLIELYNVALLKRLINTTASRWCRLLVPVSLRFKHWDAVNPRATPWRICKWDKSHYWWSVTVWLCGQYGAQICHINMGHIFRTHFIYQTLTSSKMDWY